MRTIFYILHLYEERDVAGAAAAREVEGRERVVADQPVQQPLRPRLTSFFLPSDRFDQCDRVGERFDQRPTPTESLPISPSGSRSDRFDQLGDRFDQWSTRARCRVQQPLRPHLTSLTGA